MADESPSLNGETMKTARGPVKVSDAPGLSVLLINRRAREYSRVGVVLYSLPDDGKPGEGLVSQIDAREARTVAAQLLQFAKELDGGALDS